MSFDTSLAEAKARVESITRSHSYPDEHVLGRMTSEIRQTVEKTMKNEVGVAVDPLSKDNLPAIYPSQGYLLSDFIDIVSNDLPLLNSRMKSAETSDQWHTVTAKLLSSLFEKGYEVESRRVRGLELIPLANGKWIKASTLMTNPLSFASTNGLEIPQDLPLTFISPSATKNIARANLFRRLGAKEPTISEIRKLIFDQYPSSNSSKLYLDKHAVSESISIQHLKFLFLSHREETMDAKGYEHIEVFIQGTGFLGDVDLFPFLEFSDTTALNDDLSAWTFLCDYFEVGDSKDSLFYLNVLETIAEADRQGNCGESVATKAFDLYKLLYDEVSTSATTDKQAVRDQIRLAFSYTDSPLILLPVEGNARGRWKELEGCRWDCPKNMISLAGLLPHYSGVYEEAVLASAIMPFMRDIVGVWDLSSDDIVKELLAQKQTGDPDGDLLYELFHRLDGLLKAGPASQKVALRETFRDTSLIFAAGEWHTTGACIWSRKKRIRGKIDLSQYYSNMGTMFVGILGVSTVFKLSLQMAYERLQIAGGSDCTPVPEIKDLLRRFNSLLLSAESQPDPYPILQSQIFPVMAPDGSVQLLSAASSDFTIIDQESPQENFRGLVRRVTGILDFSLDEVFEFQPFIQWAGLENLLLSAKVTKVTKFPSCAEIPQMSERSVRARAYALCRIATHFECPKAKDSRELYRLLKTAKVFESPSICSELSLIESGSILMLEKSEVDLCFDWTNDTLNIYIPNDADRQDLFFLIDLPHALFEWMMNQSPDTIPENRVIEPAERLIMNILNTNPSLSERLLDREGITKLEFPADDKNTGGVPLVKTSVQARIQPVRSDSPIEEKQRPEPQYSDRELSPEQGSEQIKRLTPPQQTRRNLLPPRASLPSYLPPALFSGQNTPSRRRSTQVTGEISTLKAPTYVALLDKVIKVARRSSLMRRTVFDLSEMGQALSEIEHGTAEEYLNHPASAGGNQKTKIGAAGELYVFELLSKVIPNLSRDVWKSKIRHHVTQHPEYSDMEPWKGEERADFVYIDSDSILTTALIDSGYLDKATWNKRRPRYYIETKATQKECEVAFFLGKKQDKMMQDMPRFQDYEGHEAIYVIFRVFKLGTDFMTHEIYVNPKGLEDQGILHFNRPDNWSVTVTLRRSRMGTPSRSTLSGV
ncbi:hypothetical protein F4678DRAFT_485348 [Xylaria arbuscula]|nr:hypothetical protein F4678DRAFT_485348 [Xylaria arbuscula]